MIITSQWASHPAVPFDAHIFAIGDCHGHVAELRSLLDHIDSLPSNGASRTLVFTGDLIDRGPDSLGCVRLAMDARARCDKRILLPGNHEIMLIEAFRDPHLAGTWYHNGGEAFLEEVDPNALLPVDRALATLEAALPDGFVRLIEQGPIHYRHGALTFVHAGINPHIPISRFFAEDRFSTVPFEMHWAWIREPFLSWTRGWEGDPHHIVIHGHTPATDDFISTPEDASRLLDRIATHHRVVIDAGSAGIPQVAAVEFSAGRYRLHVAQSR
jgi:serine/threonine protein phosphatase 1